jgi:hypothetical protein
VVIAFLAKFAGLGNIPEKIFGIVKKIRAPIDRGMDKIVAWLGKTLEKARGALQQWWKARKKFVTSSGESHEISYTGEEKSAVPMVASGQPTVLNAKLAGWAKQASAAQASAAEQSGKGLIDRTKDAATKDPNDPNLTVYLKQLFEIYDERTGKKTIVTHRTGSLGGDTVGLEMTVDWLGSKHKIGSPPKGQQNLMNLLVTDPNKGSTSKFVRGHLLNEKLGGEGDANNMFPITGYANSQHLHSTESTVKSWVEPKDRWVLYQVRVTGVSSKLDAGPQIKKNYVNCSFACKVVQKDAAGAITNELATEIPSRYEPTGLEEREKAKIIVASR